MSTPIAFISHFQVKSERMDDYRRLAEEFTRQLNAERPRTAAYLHYLDPDLGRLTIVHVFPDSSAMDAHFEGAAERSDAVFQYISPLGWEIYGPASDAAVAMIRTEAQAAHVDLALAPQFLSGFLRPASG